MKIKQPKLIILLSAAIPLESLMASEQNTSPNVILIMCDDLGWGDVGFNGNRIIQTPNIDRMANEGVALNRFYTASAVSSPTRASVLTGRNPHRTGIHTANAGMLREEEITVAELLRDEGYFTGHFGKWHLGTLSNSEKDGVRAKNGGENEYFNPPSRHGYDESFTTEAKVPTWDPMVRPAKVNSSAGGWNYIKDGEATVNYGTAYWDNSSKRVKDNLSGDDSRVIMDRVIPFIDKSKSLNKPFLAVVWFHAPHKPCVAGPEYAAMYSKYKGDFMNYAGCITAMDDQVGRLRRHLEELGVADNTIVWFTSDNGPEECSANGGGVTGGFRDRKRSLHEGGTRVPTFIWWKKGVEPRLETNYFANTNDILPTIASVAGVDPSACKNELDGVDISEMFTKKSAKRDDPIITIFAGQASYSDNRYKIYINRGVIECYDIVKDPYETNPNVEIPNLEQKLAAMKSKIASYKESYNGGGYSKTPTKLHGKWNSKFAPDIDSSKQIRVESVESKITDYNLKDGDKITAEKPSYDEVRKVIKIGVINPSSKKTEGIEMRVKYNNQLLVSSAVEPINSRSKRELTIPLSTLPKSNKQRYEVIIYKKGVEQNRVSFL